MDIKKEIVETVERRHCNLSLDGDIEEHYEDGDTLVFSTRENGCVGDEEPGEEDIQEAIETSRLLKEKFGHKINVDIETVDEWVHLSVEY